MNSGPPLALKDTIMGSRSAFVGHTIVCFNGYQNPEANIGKDTVLCNNETLLLKARPTPLAEARYLWSNGDTTYTTTIDSNGTYSVQITQNFCSFYDTIHVAFIPQIEVSLKQSSSLLFR